MRMRVMVFKKCDNQKHYTTYSFSINKRMVPNEIGLNLANSMKKFSEDFSKRGVDVDFVIRFGEDTLVDLKA